MLSDDEYAEFFAKTKNFFIDMIEVYGSEEVFSIVATIYVEMAAQSATNRSHMDEIKNFMCKQIEISYLNREMEHE